MGYQSTAPETIIILSTLLPTSINIDDGKLSNDEMPSKDYGTLFQLSRHHRISSLWRNTKNLLSMIVQSGSESPGPALAL